MAHPARKRLSRLGLDSNDIPVRQNTVLGTERRIRMALSDPVHMALSDPVVRFPGQTYTTDAHE